MLVDVANLPIERVLVIVAHPDDIESWVAGTVCGFTDCAGAAIDRRTLCPALLWGWSYYDYDGSEHTATNVRSYENAWAGDEPLHVDCRRSDAPGRVAD